MIFHRNIAVILALALAPVPAFADNFEKPGMISVTGDGTASVVPDMAVITMTVMRQENTAREALDANNQAMAQVLTSMKEAGIAERDLQTSGFSIDPQYFYPKNDGNEPVTPTITGYRVFNSLTIRIRDLDKLGSILDRSVSLGVNQGGQILFTNDDPSAAIKEARKQAMIDAVDKAKTLTEAAGVGLGRIAEINEQRNNSSPIPMMRAEMAMKSSADAFVPVASGENQYRVSVNVTFELKQ